MTQKPHIVVIGGGTGSFTLLSAVKQLTPHVTALVNMVDDGGSTGRLRDELGVLPPGDVRQCLVALARSPEIRDLFTYRFSEGSLEGHSFGNLFLTALEKMTGSFSGAIETASKILNIIGRVLPITLDNVHLMMQVDAASEPVSGEHGVDMAILAHGQQPKFWLRPHASLYQPAADAIAGADLILIAPGSLYTSLGPALIVDGVGAALMAAPGPIWYFCNLVQQAGHTIDMTVSEYAAEIERLAGVPILDRVFYNTAQPAPELLAEYEQSNQNIVPIDTDVLATAHYESIGRKLIADTPVRTQAGDVLAEQRSLIRHDIDRLTDVIKEQLSK
jgi:uncharacterized cofD-like protein